MVIVMMEQTKRAKSKFQQQLETEAIKNLLMLVTVGCIFFSAAIFSANILSVRLNAERHLDFLGSTFEQVYSSATDYLYDAANRDVFLRSIARTGNIKEVQYLLNRHNVQSPVKFDLILTDAHKRVIYSSMGTGELNPHRFAFNNIVSDNALRNGNKVYNTVYYFTGSSSEYIFAVPLYSGDRLRGFAQLYLPSSEWTKLLADYQYDTIITSGAGDILYCSNSDLLPERNNNCFRGTPGAHMASLNSVRYLVVDRSIHEHRIVLHSFIYYPKDYLYVAIGILTIVLLGGIWFSLSLKMSENMAEKNARSVNLLVEEMRIIRREDNEHVISLGTADEFEEIADRINGMVRSVNELHSRNADLIRLNSGIEMRNLQAQINPHFIYNTLDTIRYLIYSEPDKSAHLIETFTHILRYSINNTKQDVLLREDMSYIDDYLHIQRTRFASRFVCDIDIDEPCYNCRVPKLLLQPIIENSIKYGFLKRIEIAVRIKCWLDGDYLLLTVEDSGAGVPPGELATLQEMIASEEIKTEHNGLQNVARRIALQYERDSSLKVDSVYDCYFRVTIKLYTKGG